MNCIHHRKPAVTQIGVEQYCEVCVRGIDAARKLVPANLPDREWFVGYFGPGRRRWRPFQLPITGSWIARQLGMHRPGHPETTLDGYPLHVSTVLDRCYRLNEWNQVRAGDVYHRKPFGPSGLVRTVGQAFGGRPPKIAITIFREGFQDFADLDFAFDLRQKGDFYRYVR